MEHPAGSGSDWPSQPAPTLSLCPTSSRQHCPVRTSHSRTAGQKGAREAAAAVDGWHGEWQEALSAGNSLEAEGCRDSEPACTHLPRGLTCPIGGAGGDVVAVGVPPHHIHIRGVACSTHVRSIARHGAPSAAGLAWRAGAEAHSSAVAQLRRGPGVCGAPPTNRRSGCTRSVLHRRAVRSAPQLAK